jgi:hypothetical protein
MSVSLWYERHTPLQKSHHELNIWQSISPLKVRVLQPRLTKKVTRQVSKKIKALMQVVNKSN